MLKSLFFLIPLFLFSCTESKSYRINANVLTGQFDYIKEMEEMAQEEAEFEDCKQSFVKEDKLLKDVLKKQKEINCFVKFGERMIIDKKARIQIQKEVNNFIKRLK